MREKSIKKLLASVTEQAERKNMNKWHSVLEMNPENEGLYYVFISNCMDNSNEVRKLEFKNNQWTYLNNKYNRILAWKEDNKKKNT